MLTANEANVAGEFEFRETQRTDNNKSSLLMLLP